MGEAAVPTGAAKKRVDVGVGAPLGGGYAWGYFARSAWVLRAWQERHSTCTGPHTGPPAAMGVI